MSVQYPDVPQSDGVPDVLRQAGGPSRAISPVGADASALAQGLGGRQWGIFPDGSGAGTAIYGETVVGVDFEKEYRVSNYPVEDGSFETYNKVELPYDAKVVIAQGGSNDEQLAFIQQIADACDGQDLYSVVTPQYTYSSANLTGFAIQRTAKNGAHVTIATIRVAEIRVTAQSDFSSTKDPEASAPSAAGQVQPATAPALPAAPQSDYNPFPVVQ